MTSSLYWNDLANAGAPHISYALWRDYCDAIHASLMSKWIGNRQFSTALKTDLFDEACGNGMVPLLSHLAEHVVGIDIADSIVELATQRHPCLTAHTDDVRKLSYPDNTFDLIFSNSTLDHFVNPQDLSKAVYELVRVLRKGGLLFLTLDNPCNPVIAVRNQVSKNWDAQNALLPYRMGHTLSLLQMVYLLEGCHCQIIRRGHLLHLPRLLFLHFSRLVNPNTALGSRLLSLMLSLETLEYLPTASLTGHFAAVLATKP
ncbi:MAG: class I SAM-dependent methyltransferase [Cyanobacteria bacterium]|nr:class I SAM-dependent methyltransferase [Cyanobacteriota bacterium]MDA0886773.1 class I SAM-dependent methyltransferase [Cyanobacteriota bacterium]